MVASGFIWHFCQRDCSNADTNADRYRNRYTNADRACVYTNAVSRVGYTYSYANTNRIGYTYEHGYQYKHAVAN